MSSLADQDVVRFQVCVDDVEPDRWHMEFFVCQSGTAMVFGVATHSSLISALFTITIRPKRTWPLLADPNSGHGFRVWGFGVITEFHGSGSYDSGLFSGWLLGPSAGSLIVRSPCLYSLGGGTLKLQDQKSDKPQGSWATQRRNLELRAWVGSLW